VLCEPRRRAPLDAERPHLVAAQLPGPLRYSPYRREEGERRAKLAEQRPHPRMVAGSGLISHLEHLLITEPTLRTDHSKLATFVQWCSWRHLDWSTPGELDETLLIVFDEMYFNGMSAEDGSTLLAALKFFKPEYSRLGDCHLPRAHRAVRAWHKVAPNQQRLPFPEVALGAVLGVLLNRRQVLLSVNLLTQYRTYLRPGACDNLKVRQLIPPNIAAGEQFRFWGLLLNPTEDRVPGKTGLLDDSLLLDTETWLHEFYLLLITNRDPDAYPWPVRGHHAVTGLMSACDLLGLQVLRPCRYSLRHGGASEDIVSRRREPLMVKRRGGWRTDASLKRYAKETRLQDELRKIHPAVITYGRGVLDNLEKFFRHPESTPPPPYLGRRAATPVSVPPDV
jgi:hypothetical protein